MYPLEDNEKVFIFKGILDNGKKQNIIYNRLLSYSAKTS
jgi:hypothetical protein